MARILAVGRRGIRQGKCALQPGGNKGLGSSERGWHRELEHGSGKGPVSLGLPGSGSESEERPCGGPALRLEPEARPGRNPAACSLPGSSSVSQRSSQA
ncbi:hypothetical protein NDU88_006125 [Pleurodeles waltl]|uniref:Uncharacterized protein n=1 Tax=Pleurodeles waltl TaxID=8319 RepID=A0AAV7VL14_PLEWA|nr:hypothetical protein NDU88_006125 [Pleurodeles waltl]